MNYLHWSTTTLTDFSEKNITDHYERGFVFTRVGKGVMHQTRSVRIDLNKFKLTSENRRVLKKVESISLHKIELPTQEYTFTIGKLAKDFYAVKFGAGIMSAQKIKEMMTDDTKSNFNKLLIYSSTSDHNTNIGYVIAYENSSLLHYSYPFYDLNESPKDMGMGMMTKAIEDARSRGLRHVYLGSLQRPGDVYKLQFEGLEWFDGTKWSKDLEEAKRVLIA